MLSAIASTMKIEPGSQMTTGDDLARMAANDFERIFHPRTGIKTKIKIVLNRLTART